MFINEPDDRLISHQNLFGSDSDALAYALSQTRNYPSDMVTSLFAAFGLPMVCQDSGPASMWTQQQSDLGNLCEELNTPFEPSIQNSRTSLTRFPVELYEVWLVPIQCTPSLQQLPVSTKYNLQYIKFQPFSPYRHKPSPSACPPHLHISYSSRLFLLDPPCETGKTFLTKDIQWFLQLCSENGIDTATSAEPAQLLCWGRAASSTIKIPIQCSKLYFYNGTVAGKLATDLEMST